MKTIPTNIHWQLRKHTDDIQQAPPWEAVDDRGDHACGLAYSEDGVVWQRQAGYPGIPWDTMGI